MKYKAFWKSKTFWINIISLAALISQKELGYVVDAGAQATILAGINLVLRAATCEPIAWK